VQIQFRNHHSANFAHEKILDAVNGGREDLQEEEVELLKTIREFNFRPSPINANQFWTKTIQLSSQLHDKKFKEKSFKGKEKIAKKLQKLELGAAAAVSGGVSGGGERDIFSYDNFTYFNDEEEEEEEGEGEGEGEAGSWLD